MTGEIEQVAPVEGVVICEADAAECRCVLPRDHDGPHECEPEPCGAIWSGSFADGDFIPHRFPLGITPSRLLGY